MKLGVATDVWKKNIGDYLHAAKKLHASMKTRGFDPACAIPLDRNGELLNGSHRVACALALEIEQVPVIGTDGLVWAPAWDEAWFKNNGADQPLIDELKQEIRLDR